MPESFVGPSPSIATPRLALCGSLHDTLFLCEHLIIGSAAQSVTFSTPARFFPHQ